VNNAGSTVSNTIDVNGTYPIISPAIPTPGAQWGLVSFRNFGLISVTNTPLIWDGGNGIWDTTSANWKGSKVYADNQGAQFDDSASGTTTVTLTNIAAPTGFANQTNIVGGVTNIYQFGPVMSPGIVVSNTAKDYVITGGG